MTQVKTLAESIRERHEKDSDLLHELYVLSDIDTKFRKSKTDSKADPNLTGVPLDYSFRKVNCLYELEHGTPRKYRVGIPKKAKSGKFISSSLWANYNHLSDLKSIKSLINVSFQRPELIGWLDVSFNDIETLSVELLAFTNLKILYLHGNKIRFFIEVAKLKPLKSLRTLTLHGNPIELISDYRENVIKLLPHLVNFDFSLVTK